METRLTREMEKNRSVLAKARSPAMPVGMHGAGAHSTRKASANAGANGSAVPLQEEEGRKHGVDSLSDEQMQMFEKGNQDMLKHLESTLDKVR